MGWIVGVDVGGTFTDFHAVDRDAGRVRTFKRPSTPDDPSRAILAGLREMAGIRDVAPADILRLAHGTTVATNALIQRKGGPVAVVTTEGFGDLLEIGRQVRPHMYDFRRRHPPPLAPAERRFELRERVDARGEVVRAPDPERIAEVAEAVRASGADACAICFLFSHLNGAHERAMAAALGDMRLSLSSEVRPEFREFERFSTTVVNAYLQSVMDRYLGRLEDGLAQLAPGAALSINQSSGGLMSLSRARSFPVRTALSGPAAGVVGAVHAASLAGRSELITLDMGGTSADTALIRGGRADLVHEREVAGFPIRLPQVDVATVGAGGGSVAWFDRDGLLKAGPLSAGAEPGPACYGRGGREPTVTDANLLLGLIAPRGLLDGEMALDESLARAAFEPVAARLGLSVERTAQGVLDIVVANMVRAIRTVSTERGHDPRGCTLVAFGGAGPLHARDVAAGVGVTEILVPHAPGIICAQGLLVADRREDFTSGERIPVAEGGLERLAGTVARLEAEAEAWFAAEGAGERSTELTLDMRHVGQNFELGVPIPDGLTDLRGRFLEAHERAYGFRNPEDAVEVINVRLAARLRPDRAPARVLRDGAAPTPRGHRPVWFDGAAPVGTAIYGRDMLPAGSEIAGPAAIEQFDTTILVHPGDRARTDPHGNLIIGIRR